MREKGEGRGLEGEVRWGEGEVLEKVGVRDKELGGGERVRGMEWMKREVE